MMKVKERDGWSLRVEYAVIFHGRTLSLYGRQTCDRRSTRDGRASPPSTTLAHCLIIIKLIGEYTRFAGDGDLPRGRCIIIEHV